jgi:hexokinase
MQFEYVSTEFDVPLDRLSALRDAIKRSMQNGLSGSTHLDSLAMSSSCLTELPCMGQEGFAYALDIGGTNVRVVRVEFQKVGKPKLMHVSSVLPQALAQGTGEALFSHLAERVKECLMKYGDDVREQCVPLGFAFSFPCEHMRIDNAVLRFWTKEFTATGMSFPDTIINSLGYLSFFSCCVRVCFEGIHS